MKMSLLFFALVLAVAPAFAEDSTAEKAIKLEVLKNADDKDVEKAIQLEALKNADDEDVENAAKYKMLKDAAKD